MEKIIAGWANGGNDVAYHGSYSTTETALAFMRPKVGEPIFIGRQISETIEEIGEIDEDVTTLHTYKPSGYEQHVWVCLAVQEDRCVVKALKPKVHRRKRYPKGMRMIVYSEYEISKCTPEMLHVLTGYEITDDLIKAVEESPGENSPPPEDAGS